MSENKTPWTPGPWNDAKDFGLTPETTRCVVLSTVWGRIATVSYPDSGSDEANARLIAAAPEMVELLERHLYGHSAELQDRTHALLARIKGEAS
jgi:hypothetical protein